MATHCADIYNFPVVWMPNRKTFWSFPVDSNRSTIYASSLSFKQKQELEEDAASSSVEYVTLSSVFCFWWVTVLLRLVLSFLVQWEKLSIAPECNRKGTFCPPAFFIDGSFMAGIHKVLSSEH